MSQLATLFKESDTRLGVFYPKKYIIATFPSFGAALKAHDALMRAGFKEEELRAVPGSEVLEFFEEVREHTGIWGDFMTQLSRFIGTEAAFVDNDVELAQRGAGFVAVYCEDEPESRRIHDLMLPFEPLAMQWYLSGAIRSLV